jgi:hypothetical protein
VAESETGGLLRVLDELAVAALDLSRAGDAVDAKEELAVGRGLVVREGVPEEQERHVALAGRDGELRRVADVEVAGRIVVDGVELQRRDRVVEDRLRPVARDLDHIECSHEPSYE